CPPLLQRHTIFGPPATQTIPPTYRGGFEESSQHGCWLLVCASVVKYPGGIVHPGTLCVLSWREECFVRGLSSNGRRHSPAGPRSGGDRTVPGPWRASVPTLCEAR